MTYPNDPNRGLPSPDAPEPEGLIQPPPPPYPHGYQPPHHQPYAQPPPYAQPVYQVSPKSPGIALLVSFFIPGVGSMINGDTGIGILILALYLVSYPLWFVLIGIPMTFGVWIWGMIHAYSGAKNWNARHGIVS